MKRIIAGLATGGLLLLGACDSNAAAPVEAAASGSPSSARTAPATAPATTAPITTPTTPAMVKRKITTTRKIPFKTTKTDDPTLAAGKTRVRRKGVAGVKTLTYEVTYKDGTETSRKLLGEKITRPPVTRIIAVGTKRARSCDPNYSGACVPIASDVDCAGGSGNGPAYVQGPVRVVGSDIYDLDRDGDGIACDT
ncbi:G5 domain-containing protein [Actinomadura geliboluensis]|uniref:G5 domain-containing protein n=1 Tax=Actinomadura geliboluensis TaxID=882440 RepID=UPI003684D96F